MEAPGREESDVDYESSCSSATAISSRRSLISDVSYVSSSTVSVRSFGAESVGGHKPHKANQAEWEAIGRVRVACGGGLGLENFRLVRRLGNGDLGNVYLCQLREPRSSTCLYAMKVVDREALAIRKKLQRAETEKEILRTLDHPFLPTLYADFDASHYSCLVMEFCPGGDLDVARQRLPGKRFSVTAAKFYAAETILAMEYLHMMGVVYRDLKPENVLVRDDGHIMLSDFDLSLKCDVVPRLDCRLTLKNVKGSGSYCVLPPMKPVLSCFYGGVGNCSKKPAPTTRDVPSEEEEGDDDGNNFEELKAGPELVAEPINARSKSFVGTHEYLAPEVITGNGHGSAVDWWTLGVFLYEMIYGRTPFKGENNEKTLLNIMKQPLSFPRLNTSSGKESEELLRAQELIRNLLVKNPKKRLGSMKGSAEIKRHEFFKGVNWALIRSVKPPEVPRELRRRARRKEALALATTVQKKVVVLSKKEKEESYDSSQHFDYF